MIWVDYAIFGIIAVSAIIGLARGLIREVISLGVWVAALLAAYLFYAPVAVYLEPWIDVQSARVGIAGAIIVVAVLIVGAFLGHFLSKLVEKTGLSGTDRILGVVFGALRGAAIVAFMVYLAELTPISEDAWWTDSRLIAKFGLFADLILDLVPPEVTDQIKSL